MPTCGRRCQPNWDVRCCCELNCPKKNTSKQFYCCPQRIQTYSFHVSNDYDLQKKVDRLDFSFLSQTRFNENEKIEIIRNIIDEQNYDEDDIEEERLNEILSFIDCQNFTDLNFSYINRFLISESEKYHLLKLVIDNWKCKQRTDTYKDNCVICFTENTDCVTNEVF